MRLNKKNNLRKDILKILLFICKYQIESINKYPFSERKKIIQRS